MKNTGLNLFIIDDDSSMAIGLQHFLNKRYGLDLNITVFNSGQAALEKINSTTNVVILDYNLKGENGNEVLKTIKAINPKTEIIMLTSNEVISMAIEAFRKGATDVVIKGNYKAWKRVSLILHKIIIYPVQIMVKEFGVSKYVAIFLLVFIVMGLTVLLILKNTSPV